MTVSLPILIVQGLKRIFADTYSLYLKTQNYHWNVTGPLFALHHAMFESQYRELAEALDEIAERLRILGENAPGTFEEIMSLTSIKAGSADLAAEEMLSDLIDGHAGLARGIVELMFTVGMSSDEGTCGLLTDRLARHEKISWILRSSLADGRNGRASPSMGLVSSSDDRD